MACTYDYSTGKITLDFHLMKYGDICDLKGVKGKVSFDGCRYCPFNGGYISDMSDPVDWNTFTKCKHQDAKDSEGCDEAYHEICETLRRNALNALCY